MHRAVREAEPRGHYTVGSKRLSGSHSCTPWMWSRESGKAGQEGSVREVWTKSKGEPREEALRLFMAVGMATRTWAQTLFRGGGG